MKKADIVSVAKENGLDLDINLTKAKLLDEWDVFFNTSSSPSAVDDAADVMSKYDKINIKKRDKKYNFEKIKYSNKYR